MPSLAAACAAAAAQRPRQGCTEESSPRSSPETPCCHRVDAECTWYLVNPAGDLPSTQTTFEPWFQRLPGWQVPSHATLEMFQQLNCFHATPQAHGNSYNRRAVLGAQECC